MKNNIVRVLVHKKKDSPVRVIFERKNSYTGYTPNMQDAKRLSDAFSHLPESAFSQYPNTLGGVTYAWTIPQKKESSPQYHIYSVLQGLSGGYMPNDIAYFPTLKQAQAYAASLAELARDGGYIVQGSARDWYYDVGEYECIEIYQLDSFAHKVDRDSQLAEYNEYC